MRYILCVVMSFIVTMANAQSQKSVLRGTIDSKYSIHYHQLRLKLASENAQHGVNENGEFSFLAPTGKQTLQVFDNGKLMVEIPVQVEESLDNNLGQIYIPYHQNIDEVVITGQHKQESVRNSVFQVRVINNERIRLRAPNNIQEVLATELGFRFSNDLTLGTTDVQLMGMSGRNVKILVDGVPMVDRSDTRESLNQIDINSVERIEIIEGPMSVTYGSDALAGVINIITKKSGLATYSVQARIQEETVGDEYEAFDGKGKHNKYLGLGYQKNGLQLNAGATRNTFGGWQIGSPTSTTLAANQWLPKDQWLFNGRVGYAKGGLNAWYRLDVVDEVLDSKGPMNVNNYKAKFATYNTDRLAHQLQGTLTLNNKMSLSGMLGYTDLQRATRTVIHDFANNTEELTTDQGEQDVAKFNATIFRSSLQYQVTKNLSLQPGFEFSRDGASGARIKGKPYINDYSVFLSAEWNVLPALSLKPGIRTIRNSVYNAPPVIPALNAKINISESLNLRLGYANGFRAPALRELYFDFFDASHSIMGNENLKAERSNSFTGSLVLHQHTNSLQWSSTLSGFYNRFTDRIDYGISAQDASITTLINVGLYKTAGGTLENRVNWKDLSVNLGVSYIGRYNRFTEQKAALGDLPEFVWGAEVNSQIIYRIASIGTDINLSYKYAGKIPAYELYDNNGTQAARLVKTGSYNLADIVVNKQLYKNFTINAGVKNLFDITSISSTRTATGGAHGGGGSSIPLSYGQSFLLGLQFNFSK